MSEENVKKAITFHRSFPQYAVTPLHKLSRMASYLGIKNLYIKDESFRFGLNAFKVLGGSYAIGSYIAQKTGKDISELPYQVLSSENCETKSARQPSIPPPTGITRPRCCLVGKPPRPESSRSHAARFFGNTPSEYR